MRRAKDGSSESIRRTQSATRDASGSEPTPPRRASRSPEPKPRPPADPPARRYTRRRSGRTRTSGSPRARQYSRNPGVCCIAAYSTPTARSSSPARAPRDSNSRLKSTPARDLADDDVSASALRLVACPPRRSSLLSVWDASTRAHRSSEDVAAVAAVVREREAQAAASSASGDGVGPADDPPPSRRDPTRTRRTRLISTRRFHRFPRFQRFQRRFAARRRVERRSLRAGGRGRRRNGGATRRATARRTRRSRPNTSRRGRGGAGGGFGRGSPFPAGWAVVARAWRRTRGGCARTPRGSRIRDFGVGGHPGARGGCRRRRRGTRGRGRRRWVCRRGTAGVARAVERGVFRRAVGEVSENHGDERHGVDSLDGRVRAGSGRRAERVGGAEQKGADVRGVAVVTRERDAVRAKRRLEARGIRRRQRLAPVRRQARPKRIRAGDRDGSGETREEGSGLLGNRTGRRGGTRAHGRRRAAPAGRARVM